MINNVLTHGFKKEINNFCKSNINKQFKGNFALSIFKVILNLVLINAFNWIKSIKYLGFAKDKHYIKKLKF